MHQLLNPNLRLFAQLVDSPAPPPSTQASSSSSTGETKSAAAVHKETIAAALFGNFGALGRAHNYDYDDYKKRVILHRAFLVRYEQRREAAILNECDTCKQHVLQVRSKAKEKENCGQKFLKHPFNPKFNRKSCHYTCERNPYCQWCITNKSRNITSCGKFYLHM